MKRIALIVLALFAGVAFAKLPAPTDEQEMKAEEVKAKAAEAAKKDGELLASAQDRVVTKYVAQMKRQGRAVKPTPIAPPLPAPAPSAPVAKK